VQELALSDAAPVTAVACVQVEMLVQMESCECLVEQVVMIVVPESRPVSSEATLRGATQMWLLETRAWLLTPERNVILH
jgi:hypothetical protein